MPLVQFWKALSLRLCYNRGSIPVWAIKRRKETLGLRAATGAVTNVSLSNLPAGQAIVMQQPGTTTGLQVIFNGTYDPLINKVPVPRTFFLDLCGALSDKAFIQVAVSQPVGQQYFCAMNIAFPSAARDSEAYWTEPLQCNSELQDVEGWSFR
ncbi:hypothetical protein RvY_06321 [Ramazzottius varieornatus]|uniref:Uncharacterized protein n=1 Tax=Ramazzottius varieornatus TaxID=947166 RepID=A0A1D1V7U8_RAMVA|nr:hypothetical protein RvY_06321 [Ramazzottius varieornatus]